MLGWVVVEREQLLDVVGDLGGRLGKLGPVRGLERFHGVMSVAFVLGVPDLAEHLLRARMRRLRQRSKNIDILWNQQRCSRVSGNTSRNAPQNPSAPSPIASTGARIPRRAQSRSRSAQDSVASR